MWVPYGRRGVNKIVAKIWRVCISSYSCTPSNTVTGNRVPESPLPAFDAR
jgi:hypothetical protein